MANIYKASYVTIADNAISIDIGETPEYKTELAGSALKLSDKKDNLLEQAREEAETIILKARDEARLIKDNAEREIKTLRAETEESARKQGYNEGFEKGSLEAEKLKGKANETLIDAQEKREDILSKIEPQIVSLVSKILDKLVGGAVKIKPEIILYLIREGLSESAGTERIKIHISPENFDYAHEHFNEITIYSGSKDIELIKDPALQSMDCIIETSYGNIDSSLDHQLESLKADLFFALNSG